MDKEQGQTANPLQRKGFPVCPYYAIRAHILGAGPAKRNGCEDPLRRAGPLFGRIHPRHLRLRHYLYAEADGERSREFPLRHCSALTAPNSRMGHGLGQPPTAKSNHPEKYRKQERSHRNSLNFRGFGTL